MSEIIIVAFITAIGGVIAALVQAGRKENKTDHADVIIGIARIERKIDAHIDNHDIK
jgi:hypothetical protein